MSNPVDLSEFITGFLAEAEELLALANSSLLTAETAARTGGASPRAVREAFRALHTIKGLAAMVGVEPVVALAHRMEALLRAADQGVAHLSTDSIDALFQGVRAIEQRVAALRQGKQVPDAPAAILTRLETIESGPALPAQPEALLDLEPALLARLAAMDRDQLLQGLAKGLHAIQADFTPTPDKAAAGINITSVREQLKAHAEIVKVIPVSLPASAEAPAGLSFAILLLSGHAPEPFAALLPQAGLRVRALAAAPVQVEPERDDQDGAGFRAGVVRVEVSRLDDALERLSALIVTRHRFSRAVAEMAATGVDVRPLSRILAENSRQLRDLRKAVLNVRMVRVSELLERVPLLVRGLGRSTGKQVQLVIEAGDAEVDKAVADRIFPAIVHLVRNAVDHAIELPKERRAKGKPEDGLLRIFCLQRGDNQLELSIEDDGRGVDREQVARRANREVPQTDAGLLDLLCLPGLSTRDQATTTSGRGMGMDIVHRLAVDELGGELLMTTRPGLGSTFTLRVPLTITIVDAFSFDCAGQRFVAPVSMVEEIIEIDPVKVIQGPGANAGAALVQRRGAALPLLQLARIFNLTSAEPATRAMVIRRAGEATGIAVHRMLGQQEVVVRPMEDALVRVPGISGATDLGDGRPTLVLDLSALAGRLLAKSESSAKENAA